MDEILYELRSTRGPQRRTLDYIFSCIKKLRSNHDFLPCRSRAGDETTHYEELRRVPGQDLPSPQHSRDGAAWRLQIPIKNDDVANAQCLRQVKPTRSASDVRTRWHLGAHPGLVPVAMEAFNRLMPGPNQIATRKREDVHATAGRSPQFGPKRRSRSRDCDSTSTLAIQYIGACWPGRAVPIST